MTNDWISEKAEKDWDERVKLSGALECPFCNELDKEIHSMCEYHQGVMSGLKIGFAKGQESEHQRIQKEGCLCTEINKEQAKAEGRQEAFDKAIEIAPNYFVCDCRTLQDGSKLHSKYCNMNNFVLKIMELKKHENSL